jgi:hypothetical protein
MISIDEMQVMLDEIAMELPQEFYEDLNGGVVLLPGKKAHAKSTEGDLFILGEYNRSRTLGRYIAIYYGSFAELYGGLDRIHIKDKLTGTLKHEFRHHLESLSGESGLEIEDSKKIAEYMNAKNSRNKKRL